MAREIEATKTATAFRMECRVEMDIRAQPERIWNLLTDAATFPRWNSTVTLITGPIVLGRKLVMRVPAAPGRTFRPIVTEFEINRRMVWSDGFAPMFTGVRTYILEPAAGGMTRFSMAEVFRGLMLPLIRGSLPDFGPIFETYVRDLKREAERSAS